jgi:hypothetical protein
MLSARVCDPIGPLHARALGPAASIALGLCIGSALFSGWASSLGIFGLVVGSVLTAIWTARRIRAPRPATVTLGRGRIDIRGAGALSQRITAHEVVAARVASGPDRRLIALVRARSRKRPLVLELGSDEDLTRVRQALRIGPAGFGVVAWPGEGRRYRVGAEAAASLRAAWFVLFALGVSCSELIGPLGAVFAAGPLTLAVLLAWDQIGPAPPTRLALAREGLIATDRAGETVRAAYADVIRARLQPPESLAIQTRTRRIVVPTAGWLEEERECVIAFLESAAKAESEGLRLSGVPAALAFLEPKGESSRNWLERVDATANALNSPDVYRRPNVPAADLWTALENPDAPATVRAAAARVLARIAPEEASERVAEVLASERDAHARELIHLALEEDIEQAAADLDELERA